MAKGLQVEFNHMESGEGVMDVAVRVNVKTGEFEYVMEENGLPTTVPYIVFAGALQMVLNLAAKNFIDGGPDA